MKFQESSLNDLYISTVNAFPRTTKRQHSTHPIKITELKITPFLGTKTLFLKGLAQNENRVYNPILLFKNVDYQGRDLKIIASDEKEYTLGKLSTENNDVLTRCGCLDYGFRFSYYNHIDESLYGRKRKKYESKGLRPPANPLEMPGMCKHLIRMIEMLSDSGYFA